MTAQALRSDRSSSFQSELATRAGPDARKAAVLAAIRATGLVPRQAALSCDVPSSTFYWWLDQDPAFRQDVEQAEALFERRLAAVMVRAAAQGSWRSALAALERRFPDRWTLRQHLDVAVGMDEEDRLAAKYPTSEAVEEAIAELRRNALDNMSDEELDALIAERRRERSK